MVIIFRDDWIFRRQYIFKNNMSNKSYIKFSYLTTFVVNILFKKYIVYEFIPLSRNFLYTPWIETIILYILKKCLLKKCFRQNLLIFCVFQKEVIWFYFYLRFFIKFPSRRKHWNNNQIDLLKLYNFYRKHCFLKCIAGYSIIRKNFHRSICIMNYFTIFLVIQTWVEDLNISALVIK